MNPWVTNSLLLVISSHKSSVGARDARQRACPGFKSVLLCAFVFTVPWKDDKAPQNFQQTFMFSSSWYCTLKMSSFSCIRETSYLTFFKIWRSQTCDKGKTAGSIHICSLCVQWTSFWIEEKNEVLTEHLSLRNSRYLLAVHLCGKEIVQRSRIARKSPDERRQISCSSLSFSFWSYSTSVSLILEIKYKICENLYF